MTILKLFLDLCLFQAKPQDLPSSYNLVAATTLAAVATNILTQHAHGQGSQVIAVSVAQVVIFGFAIWLVLRLKQKSERFPQTVSAILGASALLQLAAWPIVGWLFRVKDTPDAGIPMLLLFALSIWVLAVAVHVIKQALELGTVASLLITLGCQGFTLVLVFVLFGQIA